MATIQRSIFFLFMLFPAYHTNCMNTFQQSQFTYLEIEILWATAIKDTQNLESLLEDYQYSRDRADTNIGFFMRSCGYRWGTPKSPIFQAKLICITNKNITTQNVTIVTLIEQSIKKE